MPLDKMTTLTRQPFAPLDGTRLKTLSSLKNRQNGALPMSPPNKRKASEVVGLDDDDDSENIDPSFFSKRSKGSSYLPETDFVKPSAFTLVPASYSAPSLSTVETADPVDTASLSCTRPRTFLQPKSPLPRLKTSNATSVLPSGSRSAPAGRSPTRASKRFGMASRRRPTRVDPPLFGLGTSSPFSLDAALQGTIPTYGRTAAQFADKASVFGDVYEPEAKASWFFDIHEDSPEQEMTNLLQHGTCTLDISSDEEAETRARRDRAEGRDKENIPPPDDVSQTSVRRRVFDEDSMVFEKTREPLMEMKAADYYPEGCDASSVVVVVDDDDGEETAAQVDVVDQYTSHFACQQLQAEPSIDEVMGTEDAVCAKAAVLQPIEGTGESFVLWESGSAKDEASAPASPAPVAEHMDAASL